MMKIADNVERKESCLLFESTYARRLCNTLSCTAKLCCSKTVKVVRYTAAAKLSFIILSLRLDSHACANVELLCNSLHLPSDDEVGQKYNKKKIPLFEHRFH